MAAKIVRRLPPPWLGHLLVFGFLFTLVLAWFFIQTRQAQRAFLDDASAHAGLLTDAVILHARGAVLAEGVTAIMLTRFLGNSARFVAYLDGVAPFRSDELAGFAEEAGLSVIRVARAETVVQGPETWRSDESLDCGRLEQLIRLESAHTILFGVARAQPPGCVLVGMDSRGTEALEAAIGLSRALKSVAALPGVVSIRLEGQPTRESDHTRRNASPTISIQRLETGQVVAHADAMIAGARLILDLDAGPLLIMRERLWMEFLGFVLVLVLAGSAGTWVLYRHQRAHERQLLDYERRLSRQREEASLGRAAAAIAHEIRNPLNAMAMGLQRLQLEALELKGEHHRLLELVLLAVGRANSAVTGLLDYRPSTGSQTPADRAGSTGRRSPGPLSATNRRARHPAESPPGHAGLGERRPRPAATGARQPDPQRTGSAGSGAGRCAGGPGLARRRPGLSVRRQ